MGQDTSGWSHVKILYEEKEGINVASSFEQA